MRRTRLVYLRRIIGLTEDDVRSLQAYFNQTQFDEAKGYGFVDPKRAGSLLSTTLALRRVTRQTIFDPATATFSREETVYFEQIPFVIDSRFKTLEIFSNAANAWQLITIMAELFNYRLAMPALDFSPPHILGVVAKARQGISIRKFVAKNFVARPGVSGRYTPEVTDSASALTLIEAHPEEITQITFVVDLRVEDEVKLAVSKTGGLAITCDEDNLVTALAELKGLLLGVEL
jgi:hypothetical protein